MKNKIIILIAILSLVLTSVQFTVVVDAAKPFESLSETEMIEKMLGLNKTVKINQNIHIKARECTNKQGVNGHYDENK